MKASLGLGGHTSGICSRSSVWSFLSEHCHHLWVVSLLLFQQLKTTVRAKKSKFRKVWLQHRDGGVTPHAVSATGAHRRLCHIDIHTELSASQESAPRVCLQLSLIVHMQLRSLFLISPMIILNTYLKQISVHFRCHEANLPSIERGSCTVKLSSGTLLNQEFTDSWLRVRSDYFELEKFHEYSFIFYNVLMWNKCSLR